MDYAATPMNIETIPNEEDTSQTQPTSIGSSLPPKPPVITVHKNKPKRPPSDIWKHFTPLDPKRAKSSCNYCKREYCTDSKRNGSSTCRKHLEVCPNYKRDGDNKKQKTLNFQVGKDGTDNKLTAWSFDQKVVRKALAQMVIMDELPFNFVEGIGFKKLCEVGMPKFQIPSRITIARDVYEIFLEEKSLLKKLLSRSKQKVSITTDLWTSCQNINYMCITAHYVDDDWKLQKRIIFFSPVFSHKGDQLAKFIDASTRDWGIGSVFTVTVDNASSNATTISNLKKRWNTWSGLVLNGEFLHVRCCAHILNLIVKDGLKEVNVSIESIRNAVKYVRSSPSRLQKFKECVKCEGIETKGLVFLDVQTRWNSTYLMLKTASKFQKAFDRLHVYDDEFLDHFSDNIVGPPLSEDWKNANIFVEFLHSFYNATINFSGSLYVTSNCYAHEFHAIQIVLMNAMEGEDETLKKWAGSMKAKFDKYWGDVDKMNKLLFVAVVLDPRYKLKYLIFIFKRLYLSHIAERLVTGVKTALDKLFKAYDPSEENKNDGSSSGSIQSSQTILTKKTEKEKDAPTLNVSQLLYLQQLEDDNCLETKSEIERYLADQCVNPTIVDFDLLLWWKSNVVTYPILSKIARDVLAVPVSTVASESAFSTGGRVIDPYRSSLRPKMVEALICSQSWILAKLDALQITVDKDLSQYTDEVNIFEPLELDMFGN